MGHESPMQPDRPDSVNVASHMDVFVVAKFDDFTRFGFGNMWVDVPCDNRIHFDPTRWWLTESGGKEQPNPRDTNG
jgi:hypothetical protein